MSRRRATVIHARSLEEYTMKLEKQDKESTLFGNPAKLPAKAQSQQLKNRKKSASVQFKEHVGDYIMEAGSFDSFLNYKKNSIDKNSQFDDDSDSSSSGQELSFEEEKINSISSIQQQPNQKYTVMIIGAENVGKAELIYSIFDEDQQKKNQENQQSQQQQQQQNMESLGENNVVNLKKSSINLTDQEVSIDDIMEDQDLEELNEMMLAKRPSIRQGGSLDFYSQTVKRKEGLELNLHLWVQNLSCNDYKWLIESVYYKNTEVFILVFSYSVQSSILKLYDTVDNLKKMNQDNYFILVGIGSQKKNMVMRQQAIKFYKLYNFDDYIEINNFKDYKQTQQLLDAIVNCKQKNKVLEK